MKDQYVGDQNDYAKYQLLRVCGEVFEEVIVAWMLTPSDGGSDGGRIGYLSDAGWREADPELYDRLSELVGGGNRSVAAVAEAAVLPKNASFEAELVPLELGERAAYFQGLADRADEASLVFFDPDNGLEVASVAKHRSGAEKYLFWDELGLIRGSGASVAIYQHFPRVPRTAYVEAAAARLGKEMGTNYETFAAHTSHVAFLFAIRSAYAALLRDILEKRCAESTFLSFLMGE